MATLNVKQMPDALYRKLRANSKRQRRSGTQEVGTYMQHMTSTGP